MKLKEKIKNLWNSYTVRAGIFTLLLTIIILVPVVLVFTKLLLQYALVTWQFWLIVGIAIVLVDVLLGYTAVLYTKLLNNYENKTISKKEYGKVFVKELLGPVSTSLLIVAFIIYFDQLTKILAINNLTAKGSVPFIKGLINWRLAYNKGAAWSMCSEHTDVLAMVSLFASFIMLYFFKDYDLKKKPFYSLAITFMLGGTIGNMIDRFFRISGVVDFIETAFMDFPIFNVADSFLVVGTFLLAIAVLFFDTKVEEKKEEQIKEDVTVEQQEVTND